MKFSTFNILVFGILASFSSLCKSASFYQDDICAECIKKTPNGFCLLICRPLEGSADDYDPDCDFDPGFHPDGRINKRPPWIVPYRG
ncbi:hypothetical protein PVAND_014635 [Polypedilum vanderplanki]|uniref:Venom protein n=1 Tax=Polypedilum vanderplanki TaxID=319348 RepID=A0A9J6BAS1_POLVA|nr:hypothetical protein PVAND_014635 [Polypedilum vanderplanki]